MISCPKALTDSILGDCLYARQLVVQAVDHVGHLAVQIVHNHLLDCVHSTLELIYAVVVAWLLVPAASSSSLHNGHLLATTPCTTLSKTARNQPSQSYLKLKLTLHLCFYSANLQQFLSEEVSDVLLHVLVLVRS